MANVIRFSSSNYSGSIKIGNAVIGVSDLVNYAPTSETGFYTALIPSSGYTIYASKSLGPAIYVPSNDSELISLTNYIAGTNFTTTGSAFNWYTTQSNVIVTNKAYPDIVTDGLVVLTDAGFIPSYPTTASTWYDLSGVNNSGSLINGPAFNSNGWINFDGSDDYANFPFNGRSSTANTVEMLVRWRSSNNGMFIGFTSYDIYTVFGSLGFNTAAGDVYGISSARVSELGLIGTSSSNWKYYTFVFTSQVQNNKIYINTNQETLSQQLGTTNLTATRSFPATFRLSGWNNDTNYPLPADYASVKIYNRELTQSEILQNYYQAPIVTDGLTFAVDASNLVSYENGSTTTYSLTGSNSGSLINGTGFSKGNGGTWVFDGTNDRINSNYGATLNDFTVCVWFRDDGSGQFGRVVDKNFQTGFWLGRNGNTANSWGGGILEDTPPYGRFLTLTDGQWHFLVSTRSGTTHTLYGDGITNTTSGTVSSSALSSTTLALGSVSDATTSPFKGNIAICYLYNRALTPSEILQNFNAQRSQFGI